MTATFFFASSRNTMTYIPEPELLMFTTLLGIFYITVDEWRIIPDCTEEYSIKAVAFGMDGSQYEMMIEGQPL
jgi:hypothetical protein